MTGETERNAADVLTAIGAICSEVLASKGGATTWLSRWSTSTVLCGPGEGTAE